MARRVGAGAVCGSAPAPRTFALAIAVVAQLAPAVASARAGSPRGAGASPSAGVHPPVLVAGALESSPACS